MKALKAVKKEDLVTFFNQKIRLNGSERKKLSVHVFGNQHHRQLAVARDNLTTPSSNASGSENSHTDGHMNGTSNDASATSTEQNEFSSLPSGNETTNAYRHTSDAIGRTPALQSDVYSWKVPSRIDNVEVFKRSQSFYCSPKVAL